MSSGHWNVLAVRCCAFEKLFSLSCEFVQNLISSNKKILRPCGQNNDVIELKKTVNE